MVLKMLHKSQNCIIELIHTEDMTTSCWMLYFKFEVESHVF